MMRYSRFACAMVVLALLVGLLGCASGSSFVRPGYDFTSLGKIAVVCETKGLSRSQQQEVADLFAMEILRRGYDLIDRVNIEQIMNEAEFQTASGITSPEGRVKLAIHNVSGLITTNVSALGEEISMTSKMIDVETGTVLWMVTATTLVGVGGLWVIVSEVSSHARGPGVSRFLCSVRCVLAR